MSYWATQPIFQSHLAVVVIAAVLVVLWLAVPTFRQLPKARRRVLTLVRLSVIAMLVIAMLRPTWIHTSSRPQTAVLILMADGSRSMKLPNLSAGQTRWDAQQDLLAAAEPLLAKLSDHVEIKLYTYDTELKPVERDGTTSRWPREAEGNLTDIAGSLQAAVRRELGKRIAAVFVIGDGTQTIYDPAADPFAAARELGAAGFPLHTVAFGPSGDAATARDVAVENLPEQFRVFVKNELEVRGSVRLRGFTNQDVPLKLLLTDENGETTEVGEQIVRADQEGQQLSAQFPFTPQTPGQFRLTLRAEPQTGELVTDNNELTAFLNVLEGGLKVLFLEGEPRQEQKFIRWAIDASPDIDLDFQLFPRRLRRNWPASLGNALDGQRYDVVLIGDLDSTALPSDQWSQLVERVSQGTGLMMMGGYHSFGPGGYQTTPLANVLPIEMDRFARQDFTARHEDRWHLAAPIAVRPARGHPITRLGPATQNARIWNELLPLKGANRWRGVKQQPGVQVLLESDRQEALMVAGEYGTGRVLAFAGDSTWQWWRQGQSSVHKRFWRQVILWLARRDDSAQNEVWLDLAQRRFLPGQPVEFAAGARTSTGEPVSDLQWTCTLSNNGSTRSISMTAEDEQQRGLLSGELGPGEYLLQVAASRDGSVLGTAEAAFQVMDRDLELATPAADPDYLERLSLMTKDAGGQRMASEQVLQWLQSLVDEPPQLQEEVLTRWTLADTWWDAWAFLALLAGLLTAEWFLRKRWGLV